MEGDETEAACFITDFEIGIGEEAADTANVVGHVARGRGKAGGKAVGIGFRIKANSRERIAVDIKAEIDYTHSEVTSLIEMWQNS